MSEPDVQPTVLSLIAAKWRMTEGQVYTVVLAALAVVLLTLTGLPNAHKLSDTGDGPVVSVPAAREQP